MGFSIAHADKLLCLLSKSPITQGDRLDAVVLTEFFTEEKEIAVKLFGKVFTKKNWDNFGLCITESAV
jgi:hypothetical protein